MASARPIKLPFANWRVPLTLSAMDLGMSSGLATSFVAEFCGVPDFLTADRAMPHMTRRVATRKRLILASSIQERIREARRDVERAALKSGGGRMSAGWARPPQNRSPSPISEQEFPTHETAAKAALKECMKKIDAGFAA